MIFGPALWPAIRERRKTVTRRRVKYDADGNALPCRYKVGRTYAIQLGRGKKTVGRMLVHSVTGPEEVNRALLGREWAREGFASAAVFMDYWRGLYGAWTPSIQVWRIVFELVQP